MMKKIIAAILAATMMLSMSTTFAAETANTSGGSKKYTIDLESVDDKTWKDCRVALSFVFNGNNEVDAYLGDNYGADVQPYWNESMGRPVLLNYTVDETTQKKLPITWVPIRLIVNCIPSATIDWVTKTDAEEAHAVIHTTNGDVKLYVNATQIEYVDDNGQPQVYEETTYRFPALPGQDIGDPIPLCLVRQNRIYVPVRAISTFLLDSESVRFHWRRADHLEITANTKGTTLQKTPGVNTNYVNPGNGGMNWRAMPNLMAALENTNYEIANDDRPELFSEGVFVKTTAASGASCTLSILYASDPDYSDNVFKITGYDGTEEYTKQLPVIEGALKDLVCESDREAIMGLLNEIAEHQKQDYNPRNGLSPEAQTWTEEFQRNYTLSEVEVKFTDEWLEDFVITTK